MIEIFGEGFENYLIIGIQFLYQICVGEMMINGSVIVFYLQGMDVCMGFYVQDEFVWVDKFIIIFGICLDFVWQLFDKCIVGVWDVNDVVFLLKIVVFYDINDVVFVFGFVVYIECMFMLDEFYLWFLGIGMGFYLGGCVLSLMLQKEKLNNYEFGFVFLGDDLV